MLPFFFYLYKFALATPLLADPDKNLSINLYSQTRNNTQWSSYEEDLKGGALKYTVGLPSPRLLAQSVTHVSDEIIEVKMSVAK